MKSINAPFSAISRTITEMRKAMRQEHKPEIQEAEHQRRTEPPVPSVATVPSEQQLAAAHVTPPDIPVPSVTGTPQSPNPANNLPANPSNPPAPHDQVAQRSIPTETPVPSVPGSLLSRESAHDPANDSPKPSLFPTSKLMCVPSLQHLLSQLSQLSQLPSPPGHGKPSSPADIQQSLNVGARLAPAFSPRPLSRSAAKTATLRVHIRRGI